MQNDKRSVGSDSKPEDHGISFELILLIHIEYNISRMRANLIRMFMAILAAMSQRSARLHSVHVPDLDVTPFRLVDLNCSESANDAT